MEISVMQASNGCIRCQYNGVVILSDTVDLESLHVCSFVFLWI